MLRFRRRAPDALTGSTSDLLAVSAVIDDAMQPPHFLVAPMLALTWTEARSETIPWEIFHGRLLDPAQTRQQRTFLSWHVRDQENSLLSVKFDVQARALHITRGLLCHVWEAFDAAGGAIDSREVVRWTLELVGTIALTRMADLDELRDELTCVLWQALVGTSRLPLTSVEAPLPAFVFGELHYRYQPASNLGERELAKLLEFMLRRGDPAAASQLCEQAIPSSHLPRLLRRLFNDVSLSPYTHFVDTALAWIEERQQQGWLSIGSYADFLSYLLRQLGRHLAAYDLITFHQRGANYPDALLLDAALQAYLRFLEEHPGLFAGDEPNARQRRRALRQGCLLRRHYEGHFVPDAPTSPGENARVLPATHPRVPEAQLTQPHRRRLQLFAGAPLAPQLNVQTRSVFAHSIRDLEHLGERAELGIGVFIDRPLGYGKATGEPDQTPLLAHEAFSRTLAHERWRQLQRFCAELDITILTSLAEFFEQGPWPEGLPAATLAPSLRPVAALVDVRKVAEDFVIVRTLPGGLTDLWSWFDWQSLQEQFRLRFLAERAVRWCVQALNEQGEPVLMLADEEGRRRLELCVNPAEGFVVRAGVEVPDAGLVVLTVWEDTDEPTVLKRHDLRSQERVEVIGRRC